MKINYLNLIKRSNSIKIINRTINYSLKLKNIEKDPFLAVDKLNGKQEIKLKKNLIPLSITTDSIGQSSKVIDSHASTSIEDLHPFNSITTQKATNDSSSINNHHSIPSPNLNLSDNTTNWSSSFSGLSQKPFSKDTCDILMAPINPLDVEIKPDGVIYLPEIKYRRILNRAFGPGGWGLAPRGSSHITTKNVSREYGLVCLGRLVSLARGEQDYYNGADNIPTATEGCKSNALMRCCKDLGIASELWDPNYIHWWKNKFASVEWIAATGFSAGKKKAVWKKKKLDDWSPNLK